MRYPALDQAARHLQATRVTSRRCAACSSTSNTSPRTRASCRRPILTHRTCRRNHTQGSGAHNDRFNAVPAGTVKHICLGGAECQHVPPCCAPLAQPSGQCVVSHGCDRPVRRCVDAADEGEEVDDEGEGEGECDDCVCESTREDDLGCNKNIMSINLAGHHASVVASSTRSASRRTVDATTPTIDVGGRRSAVGR